MNKDNGILTTTASIDRESLSSGSLITLTLSGTDSQGRNVLEVIEIEIEDINDNSPTFSASDYTLIVSENLGPQVFDLLSWSDDDEGENGKLKKAQILDIPDQSWPFIPEIKTSGTFQQVVLNITQSLDREKVDHYEFTVEIEDNGYPAQTGTLNVLIDVQDINDNPPVFEKDRYQFHLQENALIPFIIHKFLATDNDYGDNGKVEYSLSHSYSQAYFEIDKQSGQLSLISSIDYETSPWLRSNVRGFTLVVTAQDLGLSPRYASVSVEVVVVDVNDNSPMIKFHSPFMIRSGMDTVEIQENIAVNSYTATIIVSDKDSGANGECDVVISGGDFGSFKLKTSDGLILLTADHLDREIRPMYEIAIKATDRGTPSLETMKTLTVNILDQNDNSPSFTKPLYTQNVPEDAVIDQFILSVKAIDPDNGVNGSVSYRIESQTGGDLFKISSSGSISNTKKLDAELNKFHILNVSASDGGSPSLISFTVVNITVTDVNDNTPVFEKSLYTCNVPESTAVNSVICSVSASDLDSGANGEIIFTIHRTNSAIFHISESSGDLTLLNPLDYENTEVHQLTIKASDKGRPAKYTTCEVIINVQDVNDETPRFDPVTYSATIPEGVMFSSILQVYAYDDDKADKIEFSLTPGDLKYFAISPSGVISNTEVLHYSSSSNIYNFKVSAHDRANNQASPSASISVNVVAKSPDLPVFSKGVIKTSVSEDSPVGHTVTTISASTESVCSISYSLHSQSDHFSIDSPTGQLEIKKKIDYEIIKRFRLSVVASCRSVDGHAIVEVDILDVNDNAPVCDSMGTAFVKEDTSVGAVVYTCICQDLDSNENGELSYSIAPPSSLFSISNDNGELSVASPLDRETLETVPLTIKVCDKGNPVTFCSDFDITVQVTDVNDNSPEFLEPLTFYVKENVKINHALGKLNASDRDEGRNKQITFAVVNSVPQIKVFSSGEIVVNQHLDFETVDRFFLNVRATDQGVPSQSTEAIVKIIVQDVNDNAPQFEQQNYNFDVREHQSVPFLIGAVIASDKDTGENGKVIYSLLNGNNILNINSTSGELTLIGDIDFESSVIPYRFDVEASDSGTIPLKSQVSVLLNVLDINDNVPTFTQDVYSVLIAEDIDINSKIIQVYASDKDGPMNNQLTYSFEQEQDKFRIDPLNGTIFTKNNLDFEEIKSYSISVKAEDNGSPMLSSKASLMIVLSDVNDNAPQFEEDLLVIGVVESTSPGTVIKRIQASDMDSENNGKVTYSLSSESDPGIFSLDSSSGDLKLLKKLTFSEKVYKLTVEATDHGSVPLSSSQNVEISVIDVNDNAPVFVDGISSAKIFENSPKGTLAFQVSATDQDSGPAGIVNYNISSQFFNIERMTGRVSVSSNIDREKNATLLVNVCATDQASPVSEQLSKCKDITVTVLDINDNAPIFTDDGSDIYVHETTTVGGKITTIETSDADYQFNATVSYSIIAENPHGIVSIDADSGDLFLTKLVDFEEDENAATFTIQITDHGSPSFKNSKQFYLRVVDDNDNAPVFTNPSSQRSVHLSSFVKPNDIIYKVSATDADSGLNGMILYSLPRSFEDNFSIDENSGDIKIKVEVDSSFERTLLEVEASDSGYPVRFSTMIVNIEYKIMNTKPICDPGKSYTTVPEDAMSYTTVFSIECYDVDWGERGLLRYSIINGNRGNVFSVSTDGKVSLTQNKLDYEQLSFYSLVIHVEDLGKPSLKELFILDVTVTNVNDEPPMFTASEIVLSVSEGAKVGTLLKTFTATDADGDTITYSSLKITEECKGHFNLNPQTGQLTLGKEIDAAIMNSVELCEISIAASDGKFTSDALLLILVEDVDNNSPSFYSSPAFTVKSATSRIVGSVGAIDADSGDSSLVYTISTSKRSAGFVIDPNTGILSCPDSDCSTGNVEIKASGRTLSTSRVVSITFDTSISPDQHIFSMSQYNFSVKESEAVGFIINSITVQKDPDKMTIEGGNEGLSFRVENNNLVVNKKLDFEVWPAYNLTLCAVTNSVSTFAFVFISVEDVNDNVPTFRPAFLSEEIISTIPIGTTIFETRAIDADSGLAGQLLYYLEDSVFNEYFTIETQTGIVSVKKELNQAPSEMNIQVKAKDQGSPARTSNTLHLIVKIIYQPVAPRFTESSYDFTAYATASAYTLLEGQIGVVNNIHDDYRFVFTEDNQYFTIYSESGYILQKIPISDNHLIEVQESVKVISMKDPTVYGIVQVNIRIIQSICFPNPCKNGANCEESVERYECRCLAGTAGKHCECSDEDCTNHGVCVYNSTMSEAMCLCDDGNYRENCKKSDSVLMIGVICGVAFVTVVLIISVAVYCCVKYRRGKDKKAANSDFDHAVNGTGLDSNKRLKGQLHLQENICMNPINISNLDVDSKIGYPEFSYTNHDYDLDSPVPVHSPSSQFPPLEFQYAASDSGHSSQCTEAVIFRKLKQVDEPNSVESQRRDKDSGLAGSLNTLCHFDMDYNNEDYLHDWGPKVQNLVNVLDLDDDHLDEDTPVKEEFV